MSRYLTLLLCALLPLLTCCSASASSKDSDSTAIESQAEEQPQGMLKALGLKGKVKHLILTLVDYQDEDLIYSFDLNGNYLRDRNYNGGEAELESFSYPVYLNICIDDYKWTKIVCGASMGGEGVYEVTKYDEYNRPIESTMSACGQIAAKNVRISYSGSDSHGNYTSIKIHSEGVDCDCIIPDASTINVRIEYWPDDATEADVPSEMTENIAVDLIKRANRKEAEALTHDFKRYLDMEAVIPRIDTDYEDFGGDGKEHFYEGFMHEGYLNVGNTTVLSHGDIVIIPDIDVRINDLKIYDSGDTADVTFYYRMHNEERPQEELSDTNSYEAVIRCKFEDGKWRAYDFGWDIEIPLWSKDVLSCDLYTDDEFMKTALDAIKTGALERDIRRKFGNDPKMNEYLKKVSDFKAKFNIQ